MKKNEGITLIALIITIIILIILTVVTINNVIGTDLIGFATKAVENYTDAEKEEESLMNDIMDIGKGLNETEDEDLYRYILGEEKKGRDMSEISNYTKNIADISTLKFQPDEKMEIDISSKVSVLTTGVAEIYIEETPIMNMYIKYENKAYRVKIKTENSGNKMLTTSLTKVYEPRGKEGEKVQYSYDGTDTNKKQWTIIKDNQNGTVDIVSPDTLDELTLGETGSTSSAEQNEQINKTINDYNNAIEEINKKCNEIVTNKTNVTKVRSVGAEKDNTSSYYTSDRITEWATTYTYLSNYNGKGKTGDTYYEDDLLRMCYYGVQSTNTPYWLSSRYVHDISKEVIFNVGYVNEDGMLYEYYKWGIDSVGGVYSLATSLGVRPVVTINYPNSDE